MNRVEPRRLLKDQAFDHIKKLIMEGAYVAGDFISERDLTTQLEMSKTPIRAALERLEEQGFVSIAPQRGVIVRAPDSREISDHYDFRMAIESWVVRSIAGRLTSEAMASLEANLARQHEQVDGPKVDIRSFMHSDAEFHQILTECTGNIEFERAMQVQRDKMQRVIETIALRDPTVPPLSCGEHEKIFAAVVAGKGEEAAEAMIAHLTHGKKFMLMGGPYGS